MKFEPDTYGPLIAGILALDGSGARLMPLAGSSCSSADARDRIVARGVRELFPYSPAPEAALAGLYLYFSCWAEAHEVAQEVGSAEGSYWHAIVHRQEPDAGNSSYWFRRAGHHAIFPALHQEASLILASQPTAGVRLGASWDPFAFIEWTERARSRPDSALETATLAIQRAEWQLLFHYCAAPSATQRSAGPM
jgi:hypothetical protein